MEKITVKLYCRLVFLNNWKMAIKDMSMGGILSFYQGIIFSSNNAMLIFCAYVLTEVTEEIWSKNFSMFLVGMGLITMIWMLLSLLWWCKDIHYNLLIHKSLLQFMAYKN